MRTILSAASPCAMARSTPVQAAVEGAWRDCGGGVENGFPQPDPQAIRRFSRNLSDCRDRGDRRTAAAVRRSV